jgi:diguanylate cyclase (GGDEF)-like protein
MEQLIDHAPCGFLILGEDGAIRFANATIAELLGCAANDLVGRSLDDLLTPAGRIFAQTHLFPLLRLHGRADEIYLTLRAEGDPGLPVLLNAVARGEGDEPGYHCVLVLMRRRDRYEAELLRAHRAAEEALRLRERALEALGAAKAELEQQQLQLQDLNGRLAVLATVDPLTGLQNRRAFQERLAAEVTTARRYGVFLSLIMADIDHFKAINDAHGHPAGDAVISRIARLLQAASRESDLVARYGGEEFALLLPQTDGPGAVELAERLRATVAAARPGDLPVTMSFGVATLNDRTCTELDLIMAADLALYRAKGLGRDCVAHASAAAPATA